MQCISALNKKWLLRLSKRKIFPSKILNFWREKLRCSKSASTQVSSDSLTCSRAKITFRLLWSCSGVETCSLIYTIISSSFQSSVAVVSSIRLQQLSISCTLLESHTEIWNQKTCLWLTRLKILKSNWLTLVSRKLLVPVKLAWSLMVLFVTLHLKSWCRNLMIKELIVGRLE